MKNVEKIVDSIVKNSANKIIEIETWSTDGSRPEKLYTMTDGRGNYTLSNDDSVFFTDKQNVKKILTEIHGKPRSRSKDLFIFKVKGKFGIYNGNFKMIHGPFDDIDEVKEYIKEENLKVEE